MPGSQNGAGDHPIKTDTVVGWVITHDHITDEYGRQTGATPSRVGYGMTVDDSQSTTESFNMVVGRTVYLSVGLTADKVTDPVRFRCYDDDGELYYEGVMRRDWLEGDEDRAFSPLTFATEDAGATELRYENRPGSGTWDIL